MKYIVLESAIYLEVMLTLLFLYKTIVFFFTSVSYTLIEYFYSVIKNDDKYREEEVRGAVYNGLVLIVTETINVFLFLFITTKLYTLIWGDIPRTTPIQIIGTLVIIDAMYYIYHKAHHGSRALYTIHRIHHVGTRYNLSLALMLSLDRTGIHLSYARTSHFSSYCHAYHHARLFFFVNISVIFPYFISTVSKVV